MTKQLHPPNGELENLLRKLLVLKLFELDVPQAHIAKKLRMDIGAVNKLLKGMKKKNGKKRS